MDCTENSAPERDSQAEPEKAGLPEPDLSGEVQRRPDEDRERITGNDTKLEDSGPPDGGAAAWLNVLGAWCCSFSSPGWANSMYFPSFQCLSKLMPRGFWEPFNEITLVFSPQAWVASSSTTRLDL